MRSIWDQLVRVEEGDLTFPSLKLQEAVLHLLALFWTDTAADTSTIIEGKAVIHFSGVLGIHPLRLAYRTAYDYTPTLSAIIWTGRLILLELALPRCSYETLDTPWPARHAYPDQYARLAHQIRPRYLQRGSSSPMGYLIERLQHGRAIARREGARTNIS
jgi:hypothetical protein